MTSTENQMNIMVMFPDATLPTLTDTVSKNPVDSMTFIMEHQRMNYLYLPTQMEHMASLRLYAETAFIKISEAQKRFQAAWKMFITGRKPEF